MYRVLIAEDERLVAFVLRKQIEAQGHQVVGIAGNGVEATALCRTQAPDVVLMDIQMPEMDGIAATRRIMQDSPTCVVIVSANGSPAMIARAEQAGAMAYLVKPVSDRQLKDALPQARSRFLAWRRTHHTNGDSGAPTPADS